MPFTDGFQPSESIAHLRESAAGGSVEAMTQLLNQTLAHKQIEAEILLEEGELHVYLQGIRTPEEQSAVMLCCREIAQWLLPGVHTLWISGQEIGARESSWCWQLSLTTTEQMPTVRQAANGELWRRPQLEKAGWEQTDGTIDGWEPQTIDQAGWTAIATGIGLALLILASPQVTFLLSPLITLVHELGHTLTSWIFGYPAIPAFDFMHGGGMTFNVGRIPFLMGLVYGGFGYLFYIYWQNYLTARVLLGSAIAYTLCALTGIHKFLMVSMGHGFELIFAGIFMARAISGYACRYSIERPLYGMLAAYVTFFDLQFSWQLIFDQASRAIYRQGKGGVIDHDLVRMARDMLKVDLSLTAAGMLLATLLTPLVVWGMYRYWRWIVYSIHRLFWVRIARS
ncbi:hypothetical protein [Acaryochloris sp. IP29b_bin.137]|uniref:hypothetical protein n=1 Tax=Acaryochloris sp. IP29b_bin.137 TaxID=2969217 RepID=UPI00261794C5|nr:hypothetical protein [Acaryochloris sp. IP29b_bin.137]